MTNEWTKQLKDAILENSGIRRDLTDDEFAPLLAWGLAQAEMLTAPLGDHPEPNVRYEELYGTLPKLMTRITWVAVYRASKGADWTLKTLNQLNDLNKSLYGEEAPQFHPLVMQQYAAAEDNLARGEVIQTLIANLSPQEGNENGEKEEEII